MSLSQKSLSVLRYFAAVAGILAATALLEIFHSRVNPTTVALAFVLIILLAATFLGRNPALFAALAGVVCFNFFSCRRSELLPSAIRKISLRGWRLY